MIRYVFDKNGKCVFKANDDGYADIGGTEDHKISHMQLIAGEGGCVLKSDMDYEIKKIETKDGQAIIAHEEIIETVDEKKNRLIGEKMRDLAIQALKVDGVFTANGDLK